jgi:Bacteriophage head to tail connecting protein
MEDARIVTAYDEYLRNLAIYGVSTMKVWWETMPDLVVKRSFDEFELPIDVTLIEDRDKLCIESISPLDVWFDGTSRDLNKGGIFTQLHLTKQELNHFIKTGYFTCDEDLVKGYNDTDYSDPSVIKQASRLESGTIIEYYGKPLFDGVQFWYTHAVFYNNTLIRLADSTYWCGSPYVSSVMLPDKDSAYGMTVLNPATGGLHILNVLTNSRLDNIAINIDKMFTLVDDGLMRQEDIYTEPGKIFKVAQHGNLQPVDPGPSNFTITYTEGTVQESAIDRVCSTGPLIGGGQPRGGERVTAQEITAVQQSGGNRLSSLHSRIEDEFTKPLLSKVFELMQQYVLDPQLVRVFLPESNVYAFFNVEPQYLQYPFKFTPVGAAYIVEKQRNTADLMQLFDIAGRVPQLADRIDFDKVLVEMLKQMRFNNPTQYLKKQEVEPQSEPPQDSNLEESLGGELMEQGIQQQIIEGGASDLLASVGADASNIPPEQLAAMAQQLLQQGGNTNDPGINPLVPGIESVN